MTAFRKRNVEEAGVQSISPDRIRLSVAEAQALGEETLRRSGYDAEEARIIADHVMDAALCGYEYSGLPKILNVIEHKRLRRPRRVMRVVHETPVSARVDGGNHNGMVVIYRATQIAIDKAKTHGFSVVGVYDTWTSGRSAYYTEMAARQGLVCIHTASGGTAVAPPGAAAGAIGTNPISFAFPTENEPFVVDMGTSAFMGTDLKFRARRKEQLPEGVAIDKDGRPTRDPLLTQWLLTLAGHKGFALALAMESLGVLGGAAGDSLEGWGYLFITFKPDLLMPLDDYRRDMSAMLARVKAVKRQPDVTDIRLPSENSFAMRARLRREGIEIDRKIYEALKAAPAGKLPEPA
jgi:LDH2 family malate/lactate/ureidoglycolate dehydrogenase